MASTFLVLHCKTFMILRNCFLRELGSPRPTGKQFISLLRSYLLIIDKKAVEEPEFVLAQKFPTTSQDEAYDAAVKRATVMVDKLSNPGYLPDEAKGHFTT